MASVPAVAVNRYQVGFAALYARVNGRASAALIQKWLRISPQEARFVMSELRGMGILSVPVGGSAAAVRPMYPAGKAPGFLRSAVKTGQEAIERLDAILEETQEPKTEQAEEPGDEQT